jgi:hypothetical protein
MIDYWSAHGTRCNRFPARAKVLRDLILHHAEEEETQMFPKARKLMSAAELKTLGATLAARKKQLA